MKHTVVSIFAAAIALVASGVANAANITFSISSGPQAGAQVETFDSLAPGVVVNPTNLPGIFGAQLTGTGGSQLVTGSVVGQYAAPFGDITQYLSVQGGGSATFTLSKAANYFGILWGSADTYNTLQFLDGSNNVLGSFTGAQLPNNGNGNQGLGGTFYANFVSNVPFLKVVLSSTHNAFEVDNAAVAPVPLPAALPLFGAALAGMGIVGRKRRKAHVAAS